jgi:small subunit ribosomal protein S2
MKGKQSPGALAAGALATRNFIRGSLLNNKSVKVLFYFSLEILRMKIYYTKVTGWRHWRLKTSSSTPVSKALVSKGPVPKGPGALAAGIIFALEYIKKEKIMIKIEDLLEAGVHFGHRVTKWNPRMAPFIFGERNGIHIIDLIQTVNYLDEASKFLEQLSRGNSGRSLGAQNAESSPKSGNSKQILFVGTKKQASSLIESCANKINGIIDGGNGQSRTHNSSISAHYVNHRWLGGLLTNWSTMKICIDQLNELEKREQNGELQSLPKKERSILKKQYEKLNKFFGGIKNMKQRPDVVIIVGQDYEMNAVRECNKLQNTADLSDDKTRSAFADKRTRGTDSTSGGNLQSGRLRTITLLDTNCDPSLADIFVPANDDSTKSLELILGQFTKVLCE